jgi:hypothetical protein|tara:strand:- start:4704 stop:4931 length:228 start_codon:yes stop_codon:yes gene_type:complete
MATFEIEITDYTSHGNVKKECELFDNKQAAITHMRNKIKDRHGLIQHGKVKDGEVRLLDERGTVRQVIRFGQLIY